MSRRNAFAIDGGGRVSLFSLSGFDEYVKTNSNNMMLVDIEQMYNVQ